MEHLKNKKKHNNKLININLLMLFILFILLRAFVSYPYYFIAGDEARYLGLAESFPKHTLYGENTLFLQHGPIFPYSIHLVNLLLHNDLLSGMIISLIASAISFFVMIKFLKLLEKNDTWIFWFMLFFTLSYNMTQISTFVYYESLYFLIFLSAITLFLSYIKNNDKKSLFFSTLLGIIFAFATDKVIFLVPVLLLMILFYSDKKKNLTQYVSVGLICIAYFIVLMIRLNSFLNYDYLPIGVDGLIEDVRHFGLGQLLSPFSFSEGQKFATFGFSINPVQIAAAIGYLINIIPFSIPVILNRADVMQIINLKNILLAIFIYIPILTIIAYGLFKRLKKNIFMILFALVCSLPFVTGLANSRHLILISIPLFYFFAEGITSLVYSKKIFIFNLNRRNRTIKKNIMSRFFILHSKKISLPLLFLIIIISIIHISHNTSFTLTRQKVVQGHIAAEYVETLPKNGVFVQTGYSIEQAYLLDKRVYGLVDNTQNMLKYIDYFDINYVIIGSKKWTNIDESSIKYIKTHPEKFRLIKTVDETYPFPEPKDRFYVYEIVR
ncbi:MAG: hypothetical protein ACP5NV_03425 [Candidatus Woesearchaeota archaeon]